MNLSNKYKIKYIIFILISTLITGCSNPNLDPEKKLAFNNAVNNFKSNNNQKRIKALKDFEKVRDTISIGYIIKALDDKHVAVRLAAIDSLVNVEGEKATDYLLKKLSDKDETVVKKAEEQIKAFGPNIKDTLTKQLRSNSTVQKINAIKAIGLIAEPSFINTLGRIALDEKDYRLRIAAVEALGNYYDNNARQYIFNVLSDRISKVKLAAINSIPINGDELLVEYITPHLNTKNEAIFKASVRVLVENENDKAVLPLINLLENIESDNKLRYVITDALSKLGSKRTTYLFIKALNNPKQYVRYSVLKAAIDSENKTWADEVILSASKNNMIEIRNLAIYSVRNSNSNETLPQIIEALNDEDSTVRLNAVIAFSNLNIAEKYKTKFQKMLYDKDQNVRIAVVRSLGNINSDWSYYNLLEILKSSPDESMAESAAYAMIKLRQDKNTIDTLVQSIKDDNDKVSIASANALAKVNNIWARQSLIKCLEDESPKVRLRAINALEVMGDYVAINSLERMVNDTNLEVSTAAVSAIKSLINRKRIQERLNKKRYN